LPDTTRAYRCLQRRAAPSAALREQQAEHVLVRDGFLEQPLAISLRSSYEERFENPLTTRADSFVWSLWHVAGQYTQLRTPAADFFEPALYEQLEAALLSFGRAQLGCASLSPLWLSLYIAGCKQELHADVPHGPWAVVYSLSPPERVFSGGQTTIMKPHVLDYWRTFRADSVVQAAELLTRVEPDFNRLIAFDARLPHAVSAVNGTMDPLQGRLVINGWFTEPTPFFEGVQDEDATTDALNAVLAPCFEALAEAPKALGLLAVRLSIDGGVISAITPLSDTLVPHPGSGIDPEEARAEILGMIGDMLLGCSGFPVQFRPSSITMPFQFE